MRERAIIRTFDTIRSVMLTDNLASYVPPIACPSDTIGRAAEKCGLKEKRDKSNFDPC